MPWKCPHCNCANADMWESLVGFTDAKGQPLTEASKRMTAILPKRVEISEQSTEMAESAIIYWTQCRNVDCGRLVVFVEYGEHYEIDRHPTLRQGWFAIPKRGAPRPIDERVPEPFRTDYLEASLILTDSARMSAVLARKILADLLERYANVPRSLKLSKMIDDFLGQKGHPSHVTDNLHYLREIADFAAHTQKDTLGNIVDINPGEAEWTLETVDSLLDYFIVGPEKDKQRRATFDMKIAAAQRKPIN
jgi:hypothetical protein